MAIYHLHAKILNRGNGHSVVAAASYRSATKLHDKTYGVDRDYTRKQKVVSTGILIPAGAPEWMTDRSKLWNAVESTEKRSDAQLAREVEFSLPIEAQPVHREKLARQYINENFVSRGMVADYAIHDSDGNPHCHVLLTTRNITPEGFGNKNRSWNDRDLLKEWREKWAELANRAMVKLNINQKIDHRTLRAQGIDREPGRHRGKSITNQEWRLYNEMERLGLIVDEHGQVVEKPKSKTQDNTDNLAAIMGVLNGGGQVEGAGRTDGNSDQRTGNHHGTESQLGFVSGESGTTTSISDFDKRIAEERRQRDIKAGLIPADDESTNRINQTSSITSPDQRPANDRGSTQGSRQPNAEIERRNRDREEQAERDRRVLDAENARRNKGNGR